MGGAAQLSMGPARLRRVWLHRRWAVLALALGLFWLAGLGNVPLLDVDEGAFAEASREMLASGDWGHTTLNGADRFDKPIGVYWWQAASLALLGPNAYAVRLPSALCAWAWCLAVAQFAWRRWGTEAGVASALMLATAAGPALIGRAATADAMLNLCLCLAGLDAWRHLSSGHIAPLRRAAAWVGLGILVKGPVALLIPGAAVLLWCAASGRWRALRTVIGDGPSWALVLLLSGPWYAYAVWRHGQAFVDGFWVRHNLARWSGPLEGHGGHLGYYLIVLPILLLPWTPLLAGVVRHARVLWREPVCRYLLLWAGFVFVFFSLSGTKLPHYALYGAAPLVLLMARSLAWAGRGTLVALVIVAMAVLLLGPASPTLAQVFADRAPDAYWQALLQPGDRAAPTGLGVSVGLLVTALAISAVRPWTPAQRAVLVGTLAGGCLISQVLPWWGRLLSPPVAELAAVARRHAAPVVQWGVQLPSLGFYLGRPAPQRPPQRGELALARQDRLTADDLSAFERIAGDRGLVLVRRR